MAVRKIRCDSHGESVWNGETVCDCGRWHLLSMKDDGHSIEFEWGCDCGREDPVESLRPICAACYRKISGLPHYGPN